MEYSDLARDFARSEWTISRASWIIIRVVSLGWGFFRNFRRLDGRIYVRSFLRFKFARPIIRGTWECVKTVHPLGLVFQDSFIRFLTNVWLVKKICQYGRIRKEPREHKTRVYGFTYFLFLAASDRPIMVATMYRVSFIICARVSVSDIQKELCAT